MHVFVSGSIITITSADIQASLLLFFSFGSRTQAMRAGTSCALEKATPNLLASHSCKEDASQIWHSSTDPFYLNHADDLPGEPNLDGSS